MRTTSTVVGPLGGRAFLASSSVRVLHTLPAQTQTWTRLRSDYRLPVGGGKCRAMRTCRRTSINAFNVGHVHTLWRRATRATDAKHKSGFNIDNIGVNSCICGLFHCFALIGVLIQIIFNQLKD